MVSSTVATSRADGEFASASRMFKYVHKRQSSLLRSDVGSDRQGSSRKNGCHSVSLRSSTADIDIHGAILGPAAFRFRLATLMARPTWSELHRQQPVPCSDRSRRPPAGATSSTGGLVGKPSRVHYRCMRRVISAPSLGNRGNTRPPADRNIAADSQNDRLLRRWRTWLGR